VAIDPDAGYAAVRRSAGIARRGDLGVIRLWGRDPAKMLHGLITNDLLSAGGERAVYAAMLTPKGRMLADLRALRTAEAPAAEVLVLLSRAALDNVREHLRRFVPPMFARWEDLSDTTRVLGVYGPRAAALLREALGEAPPPDEDAFRVLHHGGSPVVAVATREFGEEGYDLVVGADGAAALHEALLTAASQLDAGPVDPDALETLRVEAGRPRYGAELTEETIPTEAYETTGLMSRAISFSKGCYTGQEVIVRIAHRGHVNRHLRGLLLGDLAPAAVRTPLHHPETGRELGWTTSVALSPRTGGRIALGYVRREVAPGGRVRLGSADGPEVEVCALPFAAAG
jgi:tRNA-modifying protein YgfZ